MPKTKAEIQRDYEKRTNYAAQAKYEKTKVRRYVLKAVINTELDIIEKLDSEQNVNGYIKALIRKDINNNKKEDNNG